MTHRGIRPTAHHPSRRDFVVGSMSLAAVVAACGNDGTSASDPPPTTDDATSTTEPVPTTRTVSHDFGTVEVPTDPQRVIALENRRDLETAVALGLPLVAVGSYSETDVAAPFVPVDLTDVEILGLADPNIEQVAALRPDLVLSREIYLDDAFGDGLLRTAPVLPIADRGDWRADLEQVAAWMGRETTLKSVLDQYDAQVAATTNKRADLLAERPVAIVEYYGVDQSFYAGGLDDFQLQANTLAELGGVLIPFLTDRDYFDEPFSIENVGELEPAAAILLVTSSEADRDALADQPLWQNLPAVTAGRIVHTDTRTNQGSVYAATECVRLLDQLYDTI